MHTEKHLVTKMDNETKWSTKKKIIVFVSVIVGLILALFMALFLTVNIATTEPLKVSNEFVADIQGLRAKETYDSLSNDTKATTSQAEIESIVSQIGPILTGKPTIESKDVSVATDKKSTSTIVYKIAGADGISYILTVALVKNNDQWQVLYFESEKSQ